MSLTLTAADLARCEAALTALLSPLDHPDSPSWAEAVLRACTALTGADQALLGLPLPDALMTRGSTPDAEAALEPYLRYFITVDTALMQRRKELGLEVYGRDQLYRPGERERDELDTDWCTPNKLCDPLGMGFEVGSAVPACVQLYHARDAGDGFGERGAQLLRLLLPAFKAGVHTSRALAAHRRALLRTLDAVPQGVVLYNAEGRVLHENPVARTIGGDPEASRIRTELARTARAVLALTQARQRRQDAPSLPVPVEREVRSAQARYRISGTAPGPELGRCGIAALVLVAIAAAPQPASTVDVRDRYGLTRRELAVARLIAAGRSSAALATELGISRHTARRHTEHILAKLGVHSRAAIGAKLVES